MKKIIVLLLVCITSMLLFSTALAQSNGEPVVIIPYRDPPEFVYSNQDVILGATWGACSRGLFGFHSSVRLDWSLDSNPLFTSYKEANNYWSRSYPIDIGEGWECVVGNKKSGWWTDWRYSIGKLDPGEYTIDLRYSLKRPTIDGGDYDGDGRPDKFSGILLDVTHSFTVIDP